eukprot:scaffold84672_cov50-Prasinocladus_malaysianus.AAC.1
MPCGVARNVHSAFGVRSQREALLSSVIAQAMVFSVANHGEHVMLQTVGKSVICYAYCTSERSELLPG